VEARTIRTALVSPSSLTRAGLRALLGEEFAIVLETGALLTATHSDAELIVLDADALVETNLERHAVILLSTERGAVNHLRSLEPKSWGALPIEESAEGLRTAARGVAEGFIVFPPDLEILEPIRQDADLESLTVRELEVLRLLVEGLPNKRIATELRIAESTVKYHLEGIYAKLSVRSRSQAVRMALKRGLVVL
jgi:DNA-binding NarL/FixJ family response regulator